MTAQRARTVVMLMALALFLAGCSRDKGDATGEGPAGIDGGSSATTSARSGQASPGGVSGQASQPGPGSNGASSGGGGPTTSPIIDVRGTVVSVDRAAGLIRLSAPDAGYSVIEVSPATEYRRTEGESAVFADVVPGSVVVGTGLGQNGRLRSRLVTILTY